MLRIGLNPNGKADIPGVLNTVRPQWETAARLTTGQTLKTGEKPDSGPVDTVHLGRDSFRPPKAGTYVPPNLSPKPGLSPALPQANAFKFDEENLADYRTAEKAALASEEGEQVWWRFQKLTAKLKLKQLSNELSAKNFDQYLAIAASSGNLAGSNRPAGRRAGRLSDPGGEIDRGRLNEFPGHGCRGEIRQPRPVS